MKKAAAGVILVLAMTSLSAAQAAPGWVGYRSPDGRFSANFPSTPTYNVQQSTNRDGAPLTQHLVSAVEGDNAFMLGYFDIQPGQVFTFAEAREGMLQKVGGTLLLETPITLGPYGGHDMVVSASTGAITFVMNVRVIQTPKRAYVLQAIFPAGGPFQSEKTARFFSSFRILAD